MLNPMCVLRPMIAAQIEEAELAAFKAGEMSEYKRIVEQIENRISSMKPDKN